MVTDPPASTPTTINPQTSTNITVSQTPPVLPNKMVNDENIVKIQKISYTFRGI